MSRRRYVSTFLFISILGLSLTLPSHAAPVSLLGGQAYYDTVLDITWLAGANLAASNTFDVVIVNGGGNMTWDGINVMNHPHQVN